MCHSEERSDAAISGRHWHPTPATMKTVCTDCVCSGGQRPPLAVTGFCAPSPTVQCPQICHCEAPTGPWQSREGSCVFAAAYQLSTIVLRDSHVASLLGMTRQGSVRCTSALTRLNGPVHGGHWPPLQTQLVCAFLSIPNTNRRCTAGRGMPLPYNAWPKARELFILHFSVFSIHLFLRAPPLQRTSGSLVKFYTTKYPPFPDTGCRFRRYIPFFRRDYRRGGGQNRTPFSPRPPA